MLRNLAGKHVLLLQGPMGPFFWRLSEDLRRAGARVTKVNFCAADALFYPLGERVAYRGAPAAWPAFFSSLVQCRKIDLVMLFGDCRAYHHSIQAVARSLGVEVYVFEEGYLRPDHITFERGGVNGFSGMPRDPEVYRTYPVRPEPRPAHAAHTFFFAAVYATFYSLVNRLFAWRYPHYRHHRPLAPLAEAWAWLRGGARKLIYRWRERRVTPLLTGPLAKGYFVVPLQVYNDAQIHIHSGFASLEEFIREVIASFAAHADAGHRLVFKHHPFDRPYCDYGRFIGGEARARGVGDRVWYVHDLHLPTLLMHARGTVVVNSTVGLSSIHHGTPVKTMGTAIYDMPGLVYQGELDAFWRDQGEVDRALYRHFRSWLLSHNQANGNFYCRVKGARTASGVLWFPVSPFVHSLPQEAQAPRSHVVAEPEAAVSNA